MRAALAAGSPSRLSARHTYPARQPCGADAAPRSREGRSALVPPSVALTACVKTKALPICTLCLGRLFAFRSDRLRCRTTAVTTAEPFLIGPNLDLSFWLRPGRRHAVRRAVWAGAGAVPAPWAFRQQARAPTDELHTDIQLPRRRLHTAQKTMCELQAGHRAAFRCVSTCPRVRPRPASELFLRRRPAKGFLSLPTSLSLHLQGPIRTSDSRSNWRLDPPLRTQRDRGAIRSGGWPTGRSMQIFSVTAPAALETSCCVRRSPAGEPPAGDLAFAASPPGPVRQVPVLRSLSTVTCGPAHAREDTGTLLVGRGGRVLFDPGTRLARQVRIACGATSEHTPYLGRLVGGRVRPRSWGREMRSHGRDGGRRVIAHFIASVLFCFAPSHDRSGALARRARAFCTRCLLVSVRGGG